MWRNATEAQANGWQNRDERASCASSASGTNCRNLPTARLQAPHSEIGAYTQNRAYLLRRQQGWGIWKPYEAHKSNMRLESHKNGRVAEVKAEEYFVSKGYAVSYPSTEERYDFIVDQNGSLHRVQVKCAYESERDGNEKICVDFRAGRENVGYSSDEIDWFVVYNPSYDELYCLHPSEDPSHTSRNRENWLPQSIDSVFD